jgi:hypothetical protein
MSKRAVEQVLMRLLGDSDFRAQLRTDPQQALAAFDLTDAEREAILQADISALLDFGIDKRLVQMLPPGLYRV